jgi:hypothetical protein
MLKVQDSPVWADDPVIKYAIQYSDEQFSELSKVWADLGFELLVHKQEVNPMIDIIQRDVDGRIVDATTIGVNDWFVYDPSNNYIWDVVENDDFSDQYKKVIEEVIV